MLACSTSENIVAILEGIQDIANHGGDFCFSHVEHKAEKKSINGMVYGGSELFIRAKVQFVWTCR